MDNNIYNKKQNFLYKIQILLLNDNILNCLTNEH